MPGLAIIPVKDRFQWGPIPTVPYFLMYAGMGVIQEAYQRYKSWWPEGQLLVYGRDKGIWFGRQSEIEKHGERAAKIFYDHPRRLGSIKEEYKTCLKIINESRNLVNPASLKKLTFEELLKLYRVIGNVYSHFWAITIQPELSGYGISAHLVKVLPKIFPQAEVSEAMSALTGSDDFTFHQKEEIKFLNIIKKIHLPAKFQSLKNFEKWVHLKYPKMHSELEQHAKDYSWILSNYSTGQPLDKFYFFERAYHRLREKESPVKEIESVIKQFSLMQKKKKRFLKKLPAGKTRFYAAEVVGDAVAWQDDRKGWQLRAQEVLWMFLKEFAIRKKVSANDLLYLTPPEVWSYLNGALNHPKKEIQARKKLAIIYVTENRHCIYTGSLAKKYYNAYRKNYKNIEKSVKGIVGSSGKQAILKGRVVILNSPKDVSKIKKGDILVAEITSPDYIVAIRKAAAIVTDHGGLTSHAAIVAREFDIPCIVDTKKATQVFRTGDKVEVDADRGRVMKI